MKSAELEIRLTLRQGRGGSHRAKCKHDTLGQAKMLQPTKMDWGRKESGWLATFLFRDNYLGTFEMNQATEEAHAHLKGF